MKDIYEDKFNC